MTPNDIAAAYRAVLELSKTVFPYKVARQIAALNRALKAEHDTIVCAEHALVEKYGGTMSTMGTADFPTPDSAEAFTKERSEFMSQDADIRLPKVDVSKYTNMLRLSPESICALDGIVSFEGEGDSDGG